MAATVTAAPLELVLLVAGRRVSVTLEVGRDATVGDLRAALSSLDGVDPRRPLAGAGGVLDDAARLDASGVRSGTTVSMDGAVPVGLPALSPLELAVVGGRSGGCRTDAPPGATVRVGRDDRSSLPLEDPEVSRCHAELRADDGGAVLTDLGSRNGTTWRGHRIDRAVRLAPGDVARLGETVVSLRAVGAVPGGAAEAQAGADGRISVNRPPRLAAGDPRHVLVLPDEPEQPSARRFPLAAVLVPVLIAGVLLAVLPGSSLYLVFLVLSPVMLVANAVSDRRSGRKDYRASLAQYEQRLAAVRGRTAELLGAEERSRRVASPDPTSVVAIATAPTARLWERRPVDDDFLRLRIGLGDLPADIRLREERPSGQDPEQPVVHDVPVEVALADDGVLGLAGRRDNLLPLVRAVVAHAAVLHSPAELALVLLTGSDDAVDWEWATWLPHTAAPDGHGAARLVGTDAEQVAARVGELRAVVDERRADSRSQLAAVPSGRRWLVVIDGARRMREVPGLADLLRDGPSAGVHFLCLDDTETALPAECAATVVVRPGAGTRVTVRRGGEGGTTAVHDVLADGLDAGAADRLARALTAVAPLGRGEDESALPASVRFRDLVGERPLEPADVVAGWRGTGRSTTALLGTGPDGPLTVDLRRDGPHALVAGTSGSGKSELLQTLIASLALGNRPDAMSFVLVDYKGGSAFKDAARLPHCAGLVTDLDEHLVGRALSSLTAELTRRERVLAAAGAKDVEELWTLQDQGALPEDPAHGPSALPRLVIVVDEFASLVEEVPEFVRGVVGIGMRGRSLGVHVVLATQRPAGVVTGEIRANVNLRIALRVTSTADSTDIVDVADAARISKRTPGRALLRTGHGELTPFQAARVGWPAGSDGAAAGPAVRAWRREVALLGAAGPAVADEPVEDGDTDLARLVDVIDRAAAQLGALPAASPWLLPLPALVTLDQLTSAADAEGLAATLGLADRPAQQTQESFVLDLARTGSVLVAGAVRSGRSTVLRTLAVSLVAGRSPADVHLYALDCGNRALAPLAELPHCGAVVDGDDAQQVERLLATLDDEVARRQLELGAGGHASVVEAREAGGDPLAHVVVLVDRLEAFLARYAELDSGRLVDRLERLLRQGPAVGILFVLAGDRTGVTSRLSSALPARLVLRQADREDVAALGLSPRDLPADMPAGRGVWVPTGEEVQVALLDPDVTGAAQVEAVRRCAGQAARRWAAVDPRHLPRRVDALPDRITLGELENRRRVPSPRGDAVCVVAAGGDTLGPVDLDLDDEGPCFVISGPARSGRSTALAAMVRSLLDRPGSLPVVVVAPRPSPLRALAGTPGVADVLTGGPDLAEDLRDVLACHGGRVVLVVDDAELVAEGPEGMVLESAVANARDTGTVVLAAATTDDLLLNRYRGWLATARRCRAGMLLGPAGPLEGEVFDLRLPRGGSTTGPVGRALLVRRGTWTPVQVAYPETHE